MAELATLARPYARAAFEVALERGDDALPRFSYELALLTGCVQEPRLRAELISPSRSAAEKAELIGKIFGDELSAHGQNFVALLAEQDRLGLLPEIQRQYEQQRAAYERVLEVEVVTAREIPAEAEQTLAERLSRRFERKVEITQRIDAALIGGVVIRAGDTVIDGSVKGRLVRLAEALGVRRDATVRSTAA